MSYDKKCADLAEAFLIDRFGVDEAQAHRGLLAQEIQDAIETYLDELEECRKLGL